SAPSIARSTSIVTATATTEIYTLSLHDALPIWGRATRVTSRSWRALGTARGPGVALRAFPRRGARAGLRRPLACRCAGWRDRHEDRKSTRLNSSHQIISYAVFCLKKKNQKQTLQ